MKFIIKNKTVLILSFLILFYLAMGTWGIMRMSVTFDEVAHLPAGYTYLVENDYRMNAQDHPPLAKMISALPLLVLRPYTFTHMQFWKDAAQWKYGNHFLFNNRVPHYRLLNTGRITLLLVSVLLGLLIFFWARELGGALAGLIAAGLYYLFPGFIGNAGIVATDVPMSLCLYLTVYCFWRMCRNLNTRTVIYLGVAAGATLSVKFSGVLIFPILGTLAGWQYFRKRSFSLRVIGLTVLVGGLAAGVVIAAVYRFTSVDRYLSGLSHILSEVEKGRGSFLLGSHSTTGWWYYFPVTFLLKTPLGMLFMCLVSVFVVPKLLRAIDGKDAFVFLLIPAGIYLAAAMRSPMQIGHRHILPVYPFIFTLVGWACSQLTGWRRLLPATGMLAAVISVCAAQPYNLEYFNISIGARNNAYRYLVDSNLDWGQGLKELGLYLKREKIGGIFLSYFGNGDPHQEGIRYVPVVFYSTAKRTGDDPGTVMAERVVFALSATQRQCVYYAEKDLFDWVDPLTPIAVIAHSIFVYDLSDDKEALSNLKNLLMRTGSQPAAQKISEFIYHADNL